MIVHGTAYLKLRKSPMGPSTRLKTNNNDVLNIILKINIYKIIAIKRMAESLATVQN